MVSYEVQLFGALDDGTEVSLFTLTNQNGISVSITNYGGIVTRLSVPDRDGNLGDVVLGHDSLRDYLGSHPYFGAIVGRYGNRIAKATFRSGSWAAGTIIAGSMNPSKGIRRCMKFPITPTISRLSP